MKNKQIFIKMQLKNAHKVEKMLLQLINKKKTQMRENKNKVDKVSKKSRKPDETGAWN